MLRTRLVLLVIVATLIAPSLAPCLWTAPGTADGMPCCPPASAGAPAARSCCAANNEPLAPAPQTLTPLPQPSVLAVVPGPIAPALVRRRQPQELTRPRLVPRQLSPVLLI